MSLPPPLSRPKDVAADRYCDLVLEGGITSGIVYTAAVSRLAGAYRFARIGGSSIGAFAAALAAAAELRRREGHDDGFQALGELPRVLAEEDDSGRTQLERLFKPQPATRRLFAVFRCLLGDRAPARKAADAVWQLWREYRARGLLILAAVLLAVAAVQLVVIGCGTVGWCDHAGADGAIVVFVAVLAATIAFVFSVLLPLWGLARDLTGPLVRNGFGLCRGRDDDPAAADDLIDYLHSSIQRVAGRDPIGDPPLTFDDLRSALGGPDTFFPPDSDGAHSIRLQIYATHVAHGRPYRFPLEARDDMERLFYREDELAAYFPEPVMKALARGSERYAPAHPSDPPPGAWAAGLRELPAGGRLPVVVAVRLAMSFPLLISAVPLYAIDYEAERPMRRAKRVWISDGGLCSNFPIHLFDAFVPRWPTFGIALSRRNLHRRGQTVWLPERHFEGRADRWHRGVDADEQLLEQPGDASRLLAFLIGLWKATWRWNDSTMMRLPAVRDRIVHVLLAPGEGGVNIRMTKEQVLALAERYGAAAANHFIAQFAKTGSAGWSEHRWVRFMTTLESLRRHLDCFAAAADTTRHALPLDDAIRRATRDAPLRGPTEGPTLPSETPISSAQAADLQRLLQALRGLQDVFDAHGQDLPYEPEPRPSWRMRHPS